MGLLYVPVMVTVVSMFLMALTQGRSQMVGTVGVLLGCIGMNVTGGFFIEGFQSTTYAVVVTIACVVGWILQFRVRDGQIQFRARVGTHLVYFYAINFLQRGIAIVLGLILADLLNQSLLQADPLAPGLAKLLGHPEFSSESVEELTDDQRRELTWTYVYWALGSYLLQMPLSIINPYYNMWIMQRINQDLRVALISRWHQLSLSYHSDHRTGDSIFRIYQDSAMVTAVVGHMIGMTLAMMSYYSCVVLVTILNPWLGLAAGVLVVPRPAVGWLGHAPDARARPGLPGGHVRRHLHHSGELLLDQADQGVRHRWSCPGPLRGRLGRRVQRRLPGEAPHCPRHHRHVHRRGDVHGGRHVVHGVVGLPERAHLVR